ncbi:hypothetical protein BCR34DRAFT_668122 [Clohesyomyces aquaticus]|uniref:Uncharacterized protein n=1 Tax=Clohesyomyces aquaticus TaxID=1231657 RepID=A0A1Y1YRT1_9PLEO|nr:hypothetical protein BCR34DRAFT_668122 [Clohesyomyces aquaticus]
MTRSLQERTEAALGMAYTIQRLKHSMAMIAAANEAPESRTQGPGMSYLQYAMSELELSLQNPRLYRLTKLEELLGEKGKLHPGTQFGTTGLQFVTQADENDKTLLAFARPGSLEKGDEFLSYHGQWRPRNMYEFTLDSILDSLDRTFDDYELRYLLQSQPPPAWQWDSERGEYYYRSSKGNCSMYASGLVLDDNSNVILGNGTSHQCGESKNTLHPYEEATAPIAIVQVSTPAGLPEATWIWDGPRNDHYVWSAVDRCYIYASGTVINAEFQEVSGRRAREIRRLAGVR